MTAWFVYVATNPAGIAYTGIAKDVPARMAKHNSGAGAKFTRGRGPWHVIHVEGPFDHGGALRRELEVKRNAALKTRLKAGPAALVPISHELEIFGPTTEPDLRDHSSDRHVATHSATTRTT